MTADATDRIPGIHHVTAIAGDPGRNADFYVGTLGLRLVKRTVNHDDKYTYHLYYGDGEGSPGTAVTFFPWGDRGRPGQFGTGQTQTTSFLVPESAVEYWTDRLVDRDVDFDGPIERFDETVLRFSDPDGIQLELVARADVPAGHPWADGPVPEAHQIRGFDGVTLALDDLGPTADLLVDAFGYERVGEAGGRHRYRARAGGTPGGESDDGGGSDGGGIDDEGESDGGGIDDGGESDDGGGSDGGASDGGGDGHDGGESDDGAASDDGDVPGRVVDLVERDDVGRGRQGVGTVHHVAFVAADGAEQARWRDRLRARGLRVTDVVDRVYFTSIYFRTPGGVLFEIATRGPGFTADEPVSELGSRLTLPSWLEDERAAIEARLPDFEVPAAAGGSGDGVATSED